MNEELAVYQEYVRRSGGKQSRIRDIIVRQFLLREGHIDAEGFHRELVSKGIKPGRATVFRTLNLLVSMGLARKLVHSDGVVYFEHSWKHALHGHLICENCGSVFEFTHPGIDQLAQDAGKDVDFCVSGFRISVFGFCADCRGRK